MIEPVGGGVRLAPASPESQSLPMAIFYDVKAPPRQKRAQRQSRPERQRRY
jgi:hypothetical protein